MKQETRKEIAMRVTVSEEMKMWVMNYIRTHRNEGCISLHVVFSNFNFEFGKQFRTDPRVAVGLMIESGFLKGKSARGGYSIWLPEDEGKGRSRPFRSRGKSEKASVEKKAESADFPLSPQNNQIRPEAPAEQKEEDEMTDVNTNGVAAKVPYLISTINPETGKSDDLIATARAATKLLHAMGRVDSDGRCLAMISPDKILTEAGFTTSVPHLILFLDRMGLVRKLTRVTDSYQYLVLDPDFFDLIVTPESVTAVLKQMRERRLLQNAAGELRELQDPETGELKRLKLQVAALEAEKAELQKRVPEQSNVAAAPLDELYEALAIAEQATEQANAAKARVIELEARVATLEAELANRPTDADLAKQALAEHIAAAKAKLATT